jgi:transposase
MAELIKYAVGIEVSKDTLLSRFGSIDVEQNTNISNTKTFNNDAKGIESFYKNSRQHVKEDKPVIYVMEATGIYFENLAYYLKEQGERVVVILPNKSKHYRQSLEAKGKSDDIDSAALTQLGLERNLKEWEVPIELMRKLKELTREHEEINMMTTQMKNQLHAKKHSKHNESTTVERIKYRIKIFEVQQKEIEAEIKKLLKKNPDICEKVNMIVDSIKGVGVMTLVKIISETNCFALILNKNQLASYAGLDVVEDSSGIRYGKTKISSKGNKHLRNALYMPALSVIKYLSEMKNLYIRICERTRYKKVGLTAVMRKLLLLIYTLWKKNEPYKPAFSMN